MAISQTRPSEVAATVPSAVFRSPWASFCLAFAAAKAEISLATTQRAAATSHATGSPSAMKTGRATARIRRSTLATRTVRRPPAFPPSSGTESLVARAGKASDYNRTKAAPTPDGELVATGTKGAVEPKTGSRIGAVRGALDDLRVGRGPALDDLEHHRQVDRRDYGQQDDRRHDRRPDRVEVATIV